MGECRLTDSLVQINNLSFSHGDRLLYDNISLTIPKGKVTALIVITSYSIHYTKLYDHGLLKGR